MPIKTSRIERKDVSRIKHFIRIPVVDQASDYTCGVAAAQAVLYYWDQGEDYYATRLAERLKANTVDGVLSKDIVMLAKRRHFKVKIYKNGKKGMGLPRLKSYIRDGKPVIVLLQAWRSGRSRSWKDNRNGHFAVAIGYDAENIYFMDPSTFGNYTFIPIEQFKIRWHDMDGRDKTKELGIVMWKGRPYFDHRIAVRMK